MAGIRPEPLQQRGAMIAAQQCHGITQIVVEQRVVADERGNAGVADQCGSQLADGKPAVTAASRQPERAGRAQQTRHAVRRKAQVSRQTV